MVMIDGYSVSYLTNQNNSNNSSATTQPPTEAPAPPPPTVIPPPPPPPPPSPSPAPDLSNGYSPPEQTPTVPPPPPSPPAPPPVPLEIYQSQYLPIEDRLPEPEPTVTAPTPHPPNQPSGLDGSSGYIGGVRALPPSAELPEHPQYSAYQTYLRENPELRGIFSFADYLDYIEELDPESDHPQYELPEISASGIIDPSPTLVPQTVITIDPDGYANMVDEVYEAALQGQLYIEEGTLNEMEAFQAILFEAARQAGNNSDLFLQLVNEVVQGPDNDLYNKHTFPNLKGGVDPISYGDDGVWTGYQDGTADQISYHYWAYVNIAHNQGPGVSNVANFIHENYLLGAFVDETVAPNGHSEEDYRLGIVGSDMGENLRNGTWTPMEFAQHFDDYLSTGEYDSTPEWAIWLARLEPSPNGPNYDGEYSPPYGFHELFQDIGTTASALWNSLFSP